MKNKKKLSLNYQYNKKIKKVYYFKIWIIFTQRDTIIEKNWKMVRSLIEKENLTFLCILSYSLGFYLLI